MMTVSSSPYTEFRKKYGVPPSPMLREPAEFYDPIPISEKLVQAIWHDQLFSIKNLRIRTGQALEIIDPGLWNLEGGPDFKNALIRIDGTPLRGDIEIHVHTRGWFEHQHPSNPDYHRVILDVCLWEHRNNPPPHTMIPQFVLQPHLLTSLNELVESIDPDRYPFSPRRHSTHHDAFEEISPESFPELIESASRYRLEQKATRYQQWVDDHGEEQAAYVGLAEALGYKHNKVVFRHITFEVPIHKLRALEDLDQKITALFSAKNHHPVRIHHVRPANHPERRLATLALLVQYHPSLVDWFSRCIARNKGYPPPPSLYHPFWSHHYHLKGKPLEKPIALLGDQRWKDILINTMIPFCWANHFAEENNFIAESILKWYKTLPASENNLPLRQTLFHHPFPRPRRAYEQQGLLQMIQDFEFLKPTTMEREVV